jgi:DNA-binding CsgD family transcriptional regulator
LIGRQSELDLVDAMLARADDAPSGLLLRGEPGIGKSALLREASRRATAQGWLVLRCVAGERETRLAFAGLGDLFAEVAPRVLPELPRPQRLALESALLLSDQPEVVDDRALHFGALSLLRRLGIEQRVLVALDDLQWLDSASGSVLEFALRRSDADRVALVAATRSEHGSALPLDTSRVLGGLHDVTLGPLSVAALFRLLRERLGLELPRPALVRLHDACGGNPLFAIEVGRELQDGLLEPSPGEPIPVPKSLLALVEARTHTLPKASRETLAAAAALSKPTQSTLERAFGSRRVEQSLRQAEKVGVITRDRESVAFVHPLFASASYGGVPVHERRAIHGRLARVVEEPEERARHLALATTRRSEPVAAALAEAAALASARGARAEAGELAELAASLTPLRLSQRATERRIVAAENHAASGALRRARGLLEQVLAGASSSSERADALVRIAAVRKDDLVAMTDLCERALTDAGDDVHLRARIEEQLATAWHLRGRTETALAHARTGLALAEQTADRLLYLGLVSRVAWHEVWGRDRTRGIPEKAIPLEQSFEGPLRFFQSPSAMLAIRLTHLGRMGEARRLLRTALERAYRYGDEQSRADALYYLADLECYASEWQAAVEWADEGLELEAELGIESGALLSLRAYLAACMGHDDLAQAMAELGIERSRAASEEHWELIHRGVLGFLELSRGRMAKAAEILAPLPRQELARGEPGVSRFWSDAILALADVGDLERAREYAELYARSAGRTYMSAPHIKAERSLGVVHAASGEHEAAVARFEESLRWAVRGSQPFEHARTLLALGIARRRAKQRKAAREVLTEALATFERLPAPHWATRARNELSRLGGRRTSENELSETERRVAELAASGLRNREIAAQAFLTPKSVEDVLARVYRKLGIHSRAELGARMATSAGDERP